MITAPLLERLRHERNLLAFSGGVDSTALLHILLHASIPFDIAIVHYHKRLDADHEVAYASQLAQDNGFVCHIAHADLADRNFEAQARHFRYQFFENLIAIHGYTTLLTAHQLNDRLEWFLMQFTKGAGAVELLGFDSITHKKGYDLIRPLIHTPKESLISYLHTHKIPYFIDDSNANPLFRRNQLRPLATHLLAQNQKGILKSFELLEKDKEKLLPPYELVWIQQALICVFHSLSDPIRIVDKAFKAYGYLLSYAQKEEILTVSHGVIAGHIAYSLTQGALILCPYDHITLPKNIKEGYRKAKIAPYLRSYLFSADVSVTLLQQALEDAKAKLELVAYPFCLGEERLED